VLLACALQACVAAALPAIAAGGLAKRQIDQGRKRAHAERAPEKKPVKLVPSTPAITGIPSTSAEPSPIDSNRPLTTAERLEKPDIRNIYLPFARYAIEQAARRSRGEIVKSAVLVPKVSLTNPAVVPCEDKPLAAIIDLSYAPETPTELTIEEQTGFGSLLATMRESGIAIAWIGEAGDQQVSPQIDILRKGNVPALLDQDMQLFASRRFRKQELRWQLARKYCVVALAGDSKSDFDELYDYLRDPDYAIRLEVFTNRGWFLLPPPIVAVDSALVATPVQ
jgi:hypothetical protein